MVPEKQAQCIYCNVNFNGIWDYTKLDEYFICCECLCEILYNQKT